MEVDKKIGFGGGCHWCTEAVFQSVRDVRRVQQGWISSLYPDDNFSEAVIVHFDSSIQVEKLLEIHLATHSSKSLHSMREKYRSAIYFFDEESRKIAEDYMRERKEEGFVTKLLPFVSFKENSESYIDYYRKNPEKAFCKRYISPKIEIVKSIDL